MKTGPMRALALGAVVALAGCAIPKQDLPAGWITPDKVLFSSENTIKIEWDNWQTNEASVTAKAVAHCGGRGVEIIDASMDSSTFGVLRSKTWRCLPAPASAQK